MRAFKYFMVRVKAICVESESDGEHENCVRHNDDCRTL
jgi:hypothetical protein